MRLPVTATHDRGRKQHTGIVHAVNHNIRFYPMCQEAQARAVPPDFATFADGHQGILLGEAIERSAQERQWVEIDR